MHSVARSLAFVVVVTCISQTSFPQTTPNYGETVGGFPIWEERSILQLTNRARVAPATELAACTQCGPAELSGCYLPIAPLTHNPQLNESARFHSQSMSKMNFFAHDTPCTIRADIAAVYPESCDGSASCVCAGANPTAWSTRISRFGATALGENIAYGYSVPKDVFYAWLLEPAPAATCSFSGANGHRWSILKNTGPGHGAGVFYGPIGACGDDHCPVSTQDFGSGTSATTLKLVSGSHWTSTGAKVGSTVEFWANWYDGAAPSQAKVIVNGTAFNLALTRGTGTNGAWSTSLSGFATGCHRYYFSFRSSTGVDYTFPTTGSFGIGDATCADWIPTRTAGTFHIATTGVFRPSNGALYMKNSNSTGFADMVFTYGLPGDYPVVGDWDGDGDVTLGIYRNGNFYLKNTNATGFADFIFNFGLPGDQPVAGDWNGDGIDTIGVYRNGTFFLRNSNSSGPVDATFDLGIPGDVGFAGDWNGDGIDTIGVYRNGTFFLRNSNSAGPVDATFDLGIPGDVGFAGDWNGDGTVTTGVFRPSNGSLYLKNANTTGFADIILAYGIPGDKPTAGDWNGDGVDTIGVYRNGTFFLRNSNTTGVADIAFELGIPGDMPIAGDWDGVP